MEIKVGSITIHKKTLSFKNLYLFEVSINICLSESKNVSLLSFPAERLSPGFFSLSNSLKCFRTGSYCSSSLLDVLLSLFIIF